MFEVGKGNLLLFGKTITVSVYLYQVYNCLEILNAVNLADSAPSLRVNPHSSLQHSLLSVCFHCSDYFFSVSPHPVTETILPSTI